MAIIEYNVSQTVEEAYARGEKKFSEWTKKSMLLSQLKACTDDEKVIDMATQCPFKELKEAILVNTSWHKTGRGYKFTPFYSVVVNKETLELLTEAYERTRPEPKVVPKKRKNVVLRYEAEFFEWYYENGKGYGAKSIRKVKTTGIKKGKWFVRDDNGQRKNIHSKYFHLKARLIKGGATNEQRSEQDDYDGTQA